MDKIITRTIRLRGITDIMFDRYPGDNQTELAPEEKMYYGQDKKTLVIPAINIMSFLSAENTESVPKRFMDPRKYKKVARAFKSFVTIIPNDIPLLRNGKPIVFNGFNGDIYIHHAVARLDKGVPNPKSRPVIRLPWGLQFKLSIYPNKEFKEGLLKNLFERGGIAIGLGTFRGVYGKFIIEIWE